tara:strand:- start:3463 stop:4212 length:750 start_codon:yes stop_codon:yes gene_type:complete
MKSKAVLFGLNYDHLPDAQLRGCVNDVINLKEKLQEKMSIQCDCYTSEKDTSYDNMIKVLYNLAIDSYKYDLEYAFISYSGHGSYTYDKNGDEKDGKDEGLVPSDYNIKGLIIDDILQDIIASFNPDTKIFIICDACHSGTMIDIKYRWITHTSVTLENIACKIDSRVTYLSGCRDSQVSMDVFDLKNEKKYTGALTSCFLLALDLTHDNNIFTLIDKIRNLLSTKGFDQYPCLSSTYNLYRDPRIFPI